MDPTITSLIEETNRPLLSYEFFPPKTPAGESMLNEAIESLSGTNPDFVSVTYGAGGSTQALTFDICEKLRKNGYGPVMPHLTCVGSSRDQLNEIADEFFDRGFRNIMTLRGDPPKGEETFVPPADGLSNARDLVTLLRERHSEFCCGVAGYPEQHPEAASPESERAYLKEKIDAGGGFITTQMFFDNQHYFDFVDHCRSIGITTPIVPGLLPASSVKQASRFSSMCGTSFPDALYEQLAEVGGEGKAAEDVGIRWCAEQLTDLLKRGAPGIHLYILNRSRAALHPDLVQVFRRFINA